MGEAKNIQIPGELVIRIDDFIAGRQWGYTSRADVVAQAVREFLVRYGAAPARAPSEVEEIEKERGAIEDLERLHDREKR